MAKIGIPMTLSYYEYYPFWRSWLEDLGLEVITSPPTTREILDWGVQQTVNDACVPIKLIHGHVVYLKDKVDWIFIPRMVQVAAKETFCPKFLGLPDLLRASIKNLPPLLSPRVALPYGRLSLYTLCGRTAKELGYSYWAGYQAGRKALAEWRLYQDKIHSGLLPREALGLRPRWKVQGKPIRLALLGYPYLVNDDYISGNILPLLEKLNVQVFTADMAPHPQRLAERMPKTLFWHYSNQVLWACMYFLERNLVDGVIHLTAFSCGPDAMVSKLLELETKGKIPFTTLTLDEHTGQAGIVTRVEAFLDMLTRKRAG
ncbi:MAG: acyl-CoA dehydratase activase-related protein [Limnochordia bacterium]|jgi:predicted nucleotide-binding protein (sugar kinase/HSP70/actin superfamily)